MEPKLLEAEWNVVEGSTALLGPRQACRINRLQQHTILGQYTLQRCECRHGIAKRNARQTCQRSVGITCFEQ